MGLLLARQLGLVLGCQSERLHLEVVVVEEHKVYKIQLCV